MGMKQNLSSIIRVLTKAPYRSVLPVLSMTDLYRFIQIDKGDEQYLIKSNSPLHKLDIYTRAKILNAWYDDGKESLARTHLRYENTNFINDLCDAWCMLDRENLVSAVSNIEEFMHLNIELPIYNTNDVHSNTDDGVDSKLETSDFLTEEEKYWAWANEYGYNPYSP
jgi:hypothetical protein